MKLLLNGSCILFCVACMSGCVGTPEVGKSTYYPGRGTLVATVAAPLGRAMGAANTSMEKLFLRPMIVDRDGFSARIDGSANFGAVDQSHEIRVHLNSVDASKTRIEFHILGRRDEGKLRQLLAEIEKELGTAAPGGSVAKS